jgi:CheY-like chemotaxis protein
MPRVLVIDDSPMLLELTTQALAAAGIEAAGAMDLASLDQRLAGPAFDLILVDVNMPEMFGDDVVEFLRTQKRTRAQLVLYSDLPAVELAKRAESAGADGYLPKSQGLDACVKWVRERLAGGSPAPAGAKRRRILIVDDSETVAKVLQAELTSKGFDVLTAASADQATKIILKKQTRPELVLLDVRMPNVNGEQLCRFIKGNSLFAGIKVLLCSSERVDELQRICREAGADGYVSKDAVLAKVLQLS